VQEKNRSFPLFCYFSIHYFILAQAEEKLLTKSVLKQQRDILLSLTHIYKQAQRLLNALETKKTVLHDLKEIRINSPQKT